MKVTMTIEFEIDDDSSVNEQRDYFWSEFLNYSVCSHLEDTLKWHSKNINISSSHQKVAKILSTGKITNFQTHTWQSHNSVTRVFSLHKKIKSWQTKCSVYSEKK